MRSFTCSAILFDLDGVLLDSTRVVTEQYTRWARENGLDPEYVMEAAHGVRTVEVIRRVAPHLDAVAETKGNSPCGFPFFTCDSKTWRCT